MDIGERYAHYVDKLHDVEQHVREINGKMFIFTRSGETILCSEIVYHQETVQRHLFKGF